MEVQEIQMAEIFADPEFNCRGQIAPMDVADLKKDIEAKGLLQPVLVTPIKKDGFKWKLVAGYRRHYAHKLLKRETIHAVIKEGLSDTQAQIFNLTENLQRQNLNILQEAKATYRLYMIGLTLSNIAKELQVSIGWVQIRLAVLEMPQDIQQEIAAGLLTQQQILDISRLQTDEKYEAIRRIKDAKLKGQKVIVRRPKVINPYKKKERKRTEIFAIMDHISETIGNGLHSRMLAWCAGEISTLELLRDIKEDAEKHNIPYETPRQLFEKV